VRPVVFPSRPSLVAVRILLFLMSNPNVSATGGILDLLVISIVT